MLSTESFMRRRSALPTRSQGLWILLASINAGCGARSGLDLETSLNGDGIGTEGPKRIESDRPGTPSQDPNVPATAGGVNDEPRGLPQPTAIPPVPSTPDPVPLPATAQPPVTVPAATPAVPTAMPPPPAPMPTATPATFDPVACRTEADATYGPEGFDGVSSIFLAGDEQSTGCLGFRDGSACIYGTVAAAGPNYSNWGTMLGFVLSSAEDVPFDAAARGITYVSFTITGLDGETQLRPSLQSFVSEDGSSAPGSQVQYVGDPITFDGDYTYRLDGFTLPPWTDAPDSPATPDVTRLHSLQIQTVSTPEKDVQYSWCISNLRWSDALGTVIEVAPRRIP